MEYLPQPLILEILGRLTDSTDLARCRLVSKNLNAISYEVRTITLLCSLSRYLKSRSPDSKTLITPFKTIFCNLILSSRTIESVSIGVDESLGGISFDDFEDESDDLYLTDPSFVKEWLMKISGELRSLSVSDFWIQSCWRRSDVLALVSSCCHCLCELELKNAWLSVDGLNPLPTLTSLTLEFIRLDDEDLVKVNDCFPYLQVLNLIGVGGLKEPKIFLLHLKSCQWTVSNAPLSLSIIAPNLVTLKLKCIKPRSLVLETPLLSDFHLSLEKANELRVKELLNLTNLHIESSNLSGFFGSFPFGQTVKKLTLDSLKQAESIEVMNFSLETLFDIFPEISSLTLGPGAWSELEACFRTRGWESRIVPKGLIEISAHVMVYDIDVTLSFISSILDKCIKVSDMAVLFHCNGDSNIGSKIISRCTADHPEVRWRWGTRKE